MFDARQSDMHDVTGYAPVRIVLLGMVKAIFGLMVLAMGAVALWATAGGEMKPTHPGDMPQWWMYVVGAGLASVGLAIASGGAGCMASAFARGCYFKAGTEGLAVRMPAQGWFGRFKLVEYQFRWEQIEQLVHHTHRINLIPVARELHVRLHGGREVVVPRFYFSANVERLREELLKIRALA